MNVRQIKLNAVEDVQSLVNAADRCQYAVDICYNRIVIDAKSLMGIMSMDLRNALAVRYCTEDSAILEPVLDKLAV